MHMLDSLMHMQGRMDGMTEPFRPNTGKPTARTCEACGVQSPAAISYYRQTVPGRWLCFKCVTKIQKAARHPARR